MSPNPASGRAAQGWRSGKRGHPLASAPPNGIHAVRYGPITVDADVQRNVFLGLLAGLLLSTALALALEFRRERAPGGLANKHLTSTDDGLVRRLVARRRRTEGRASAGS